MLQTDAAIDVAILADAVDHLEVVLREKSRMGLQKEDKFISKSKGILLIVPVIAEGPCVHALPRSLERLRTKRTSMRPVL